ncbi:RbsD/FucU family protein [Corynebacterium uterequi]|uniref:Fucose dissimilation pathway protein FucU n=1 Tax=Corynebacterium uterequi TaxID=1072256 RepID=A0A0G3HGQ4_9CORY|nr:RbsD/FucU domain-containing protein [Corynebacterium uterequi]AKK11950.1 fucose dissimilation pathway protein FucU [Corynebacterium uterequi]
MLKNIPQNLSPDLLYVLARMGHGDEIVIADGNFPADSVNSTVVRADGHGVPAIMESILQLMPLDPYSEWQVGLMSTVDGDPTPEIWATFTDLADAAYPGHTVKFFERFEFYERARTSFAVVATSETALYGNVILKKGVVIPD